MEFIISHLIFWPFIIGGICRIIPEKTKFVREFLSFITTLFLFIFSIKFFGIEKNWYPEPFFFSDTLSSFIFIGISLFGLLIVIYSIAFMKGKDFQNRYYSYILWTISASTGTVFSNHLILLSAFWGFLGITLYLLVNIGGEKAAYGAKKTFIIVGGSDSFLILGIALLWILTGSLYMDQISVSMTTRASYAAFLSLVIASLAKAGAMPFHTWIPEISESAPTSVMAFLPASLDKLLGIYLLARICLNLFQFHYGLWLLLRFIGAITIVAAVMMAIIQHNMKKLLSYHAVSQVGYMVLGIATGNPIGIAGGLFHMLNNAIYKCCLFLGAGAVEEKTKTTELEQLGGLGKFMPFTFSCFLIASLSISGVPPFNGFFSKWMVYQGLFEGAKDGSVLWTIWIIAAMIGSALTLASFLKIIHSVFLGHSKEYQGKIKEVSFWMVLPSIVLAVFCIVFGIGYKIPTNLFLKPVVSGISQFNVFLLIPSLSVIIIGLIFGFLGYIIFSSLKFKKATSFVGGEKVIPEMEMSGTEFYRTIEDIFPRIYKGAKNKIFDIYDIGKSIIFYFGNAFSSLHNGVLLTYISWILFGVMILLFLFIRI